MNPVALLKRTVLPPVIFILLFNTGVTAQDREFWFVAPDLARRNNGNNETVDRPVFFVVSAGTENAVVTMSQPANGSFPVKVFNIAANSSQRIVFSSDADMQLIENSVLDATCGVKNNKGILFTSTAPVTIYYQVDSDNSKDIFTLKGSKALGTKFYTPFQTRWMNSDDHNDAYPQFHIVASENNTQVSITPKANIVGTDAGVTKTVILNRGETFAARARQASLRLDGSEIIADKPVAVVVADDEMHAGGALDVGGDQIAPTSFLGADYVVIRGFTENAYGDYVYILATEPNTEIYFDDSNTVQATLQAGETHEMYMGTSTPSRYIRSSKPVYVYQVSGVRAELGAALVPGMYSINSRRISLYIGASNSGFADYLFLLVRTGNESNFLLNGESGKINASDFRSITGLDDWKYARINVSSIVAKAAVNVLANTQGVFALGYFRDATTSALYGYLSMFGQLEIPDTTYVCSGKSLTLDAGYAKSYKWWKDGDESNIISETATCTVPPDTRGWYYVRVNQDPFTVTDSTYVDIEPFNLTTNIPLLLKAGTPYNFSANAKRNDNKVFTWNFPDAQPDVSSDSSPANIVWNESCEVNLSLTVKNSDINCDTLLTRKITVYKANDTVICMGANLSLSPVRADVQAEVKWYSDSLHTDLIHAGKEFIVNNVLVDTVFYFTVSANGVDIADKIGISVVKPPSVQAMNDTLICYGQTVELSAQSDGSPYVWNVDNTTVSPVSSFEYIVTASRFPCPDVHDTVSITAGDSLYILPEVLPPHQKGAPYTQQFTGNAQNPVFTSLNLPAGFTLSSNGELNYLSATVTDSEFTVTVTDRHGCVAYREYEMTSILFVPEIFTPNSDGVNDIFMKGFSLVIFDRYGIKIHEGDDGWDGTYKGKAVPSDTYFYILYYTDDNGAKAMSKGVITILGIE
jgi:gliding motility-associated-like protein